MGYRQGDTEGTRTRGGAIVTFEEVLTQTIAMLQRLGCVSYRALKRQFAIDDAFLEDLKYETHRGPAARRRPGRQRAGRDWGASTAPASMPASVTCAAVPPPALRHAREPLAYTPSLSRREDSDLPQCAGRRTQAGHRAVCRSQRLDGTPWPIATPRTPGSSSIRCWSA